MYHSYQSSFALFANCPISAHVHRVSIGANHRQGDAGGDPLGRGGRLRVRFAANAGESPGCVNVRTHTTQTAKPPVNL